MMQDNWHLPVTLHAVGGPPGVGVLNGVTKVQKQKKNGGPVDESFCHLIMYNCFLVFI